MVEPCRCPLCGLPFSDRGFNFVEPFIAFGGDYRQLTKREAQIFGALFKARPHFVLKDRLYNALVADQVHDSEWPEPKIVHVLISNIRKKLAALGDDVRIINAPGSGYALVQDFSASMPEAAGAAAERANA
jgi:DNA-binding winged helix-turn-helix (wHTH) protein